jgi:RNA recognition motif-containing protein
LLTTLQLNGFEVRKGKSIAILPSLNNHRLFVGNIPKNRDREELFEEFTKHARKSKNIKYARMIGHVTDPFGHVTRSCSYKETLEKFYSLSS